MKFSICADIVICAIVLIIAFAGFTQAELEQSKNRRGGGGTSGLFAFPRVGRSDPSMANSMHEMEAAATGMVPAAFESFYANSMEDYEEFPKNEIKRANLIAFPRIGRSDAEIRKWARFLALQQAYDKRTGPSATSGLWFGPRLGKRSVDAAKDNHQVKHEKEQF